MPPKAKFTKKEVIDSAFELTKNYGISAVTARELGKTLNCSMSPIFTVCKNMEEIHTEIVQKAKHFYNEKYAKKGLAEVPAFKGFGMQYIQFAVDEPQLFQLLFMTKISDNQDALSALSLMGENYPYLLELIRNEYELDEASSKEFLQQLWIHCHGMAVLCATKVCNFSQEQIAQKLGEICFGLLLGFQSHKFEQCGRLPEHLDHSLRKELKNMLQN